MGPVAVLGRNQQRKRPERGAAAILVAVAVSLQLPFKHTITSVCSAPLRFTSNPRDGGTHSAVIFLKPRHGRADEMLDVVGNARLPSAPSSPSTAHSNPPLREAEARPMMSRESSFRQLTTLVPAFGKRLQTEIPVASGELSKG